MADGMNASVRSIWASLAFCILPGYLANVTLYYQHQSCSSKAVTRRRSPSHGGGIDLYLLICDRADSKT